VFGKRERERPEIVASSLSASYSFLTPPLSSSSLLPRQAVDFHAATIRVPMCCNNCVLREKTVVRTILLNGRRSHNKRQSLARKWRWLFNADADALSHSYVTRFIVFYQSCVKYFLKPSSQRICATYDVAD